MKKIVTLLLFMTPFIGFSQNVPIDFETGGQGANWTWTVFQNADNPPLEFVSNPDPSGINQSATVAKFTARDTNAGAAPFAGLESQHGSDIGTFDLTAENALVTIMVYKTKISDVGIKFATPTGGAQMEIKVANTLINQWEQISIDFSGYIGLPETTGLDQIIVFPDFIPRTADDIIYFDNITFGEAIPNTIGLPITLEGGQAPAFSDFNGSTTVAVTNPDASGSNTSATVAQNIVPAGAAFAGVNFPVNNIDITTDKVFSLSVWSPLPNTPVLLKLENASGVNSERIGLTSSENTWETITFDFTDEGQLTYQSATIFMNFNQTDAANQVYYWDNLVLGETLGVSDNTLVDIKVYPNPATSMLHIEANQEIQTIEIANLLGQIKYFKAIDTKNSTIDVSNLATGLYISRVVFYDGTIQNIKFLKQ